MVDTLAKTVGQVNSNTLDDTVGDGKAQALIVTMTDTIPEEEDETLGVDTLPFGFKA